jgi:hypothetical protein
MNVSPVENDDILQDGRIVIAEIHKDFIPRFS